MKYKCYLVYVKCDNCNNWELVGHHDYYACALSRKKEAIKMFGESRVKITKEEKNV